MPTYDYVCQACGHALEFFQSFSEAPKRKCPDCGALRLKRLIGTGGGIIFKGSGFYETDYRTASYKQAAAADKQAAEGKSETDKADTKSDVKAGTKADTKGTGAEPKPAAKSPSKGPSKAKEPGTTDG